MSDSHSKCISFEWQSFKIIVFWLTLIISGDIMTYFLDVFFIILFLVDILCVILCHLPITMLKTCVGSIWHTYNSSDSPSECLYFEWHSLKVYVFWVTVIQRNSILTDTHNIRAMLWYIFFSDIFGIIIFVLYIFMLTLSHFPIKIVQNMSWCDLTYYYFKWQSQECMSFE